MPMSDWARTSLLDVAGKLIESDESRLRSMFGARGIDRFMHRQRTPGQFSAYQVWCVAMLESWLRNHPVKLPQLESKDISATSPSRRAVARLDAHTFLLFPKPAEIPSQTTNTRKFSTIPGRTSRYRRPISRDLRHCGAQRCFVCGKRPFWISASRNSTACESSAWHGRSSRLTYDRDQTIWMDIRTMTRAERVWSMARLWPHAIGVVSNRRLAKPLRPTRFAASNSELNVSAPIEPHRRGGESRSFELIHAV